MSWTVEAGDVLTYAYRIVGKSMHLVFYLEGTTVGGTVSQQLFLLIPGGFTNSLRVMNTTHIIDNGTENIGVAYISTTGDTTVTINKVPWSNFTLSTNNTRVRGQLEIPIS
jgi:hypothetical protein